MNTIYSNYITEEIQKKSKNKIKIPKGIKERNISNKEGETDSEKDTPHYNDTNNILLKEMWNAYYEIDYSVLLMKRLKHYVYFKHYSESKKRNEEIKNDILSEINKKTFDTEEERQTELNLSIHDYEIISAACNLFLEEHKDEFAKYIIDGKAILDYKPKELEAKIDEKMKILSDILTISYGEFGQNNGILTKYHTDYIRNSIGIDFLPQDFNLVMNKMYHYESNEEEFLNFLNEEANKMAPNQEMEDARPLIPLDETISPFNITSDGVLLMNEYESIRVSSKMADDITEFLFRAFIEHGCLVYVESILSQNYSQSMIEEFMKVVELSFTYIYKNSLKDEPIKKEYSDYEITSIPRALETLSSINYETIFEKFQNIFLESTMPILRNYIAKHRELRHSIFINYWSDFGGMILGAIRDTINNAIVLSNQPLIDSCEEEEYEIESFLIDISERLENDYYNIGNYERIKYLQKLQQKEKLWI